MIHSFVALFEVYFWCSISL